MSCKKGGKTKKHLLLAKLVTGERAPCVFCRRDVDDEIIYGKLYAIGDIQCHYFCVLLSCCLIQKGKDDEGLFGFLYPDIIAEVERSKKHKCSYCGRDGATLGCSVSQCRKQFHLPCGREKDAVSLFYGNYKTFCQRHAPKQKINDEIMAKSRLRLMAKRKLTMLKNKQTIKKETDDTCSENNIDMNVEDELNQEIEAICVICYESVDGYPTQNTFWPPCCARDAWFHRSCLQRMALSAGMHYIKCPLCNQKETFFKAVLSQGYYVPDRDAAWELEQNAFSEIYERSVSCTAPNCICPKGRDYDADTGSWDLKACILCGSSGIHSGCAQGDAVQEGGGVVATGQVVVTGHVVATGQVVATGHVVATGQVVATRGGRYVCATCAPAAPADIDTLADSMEAVSLRGERRDERRAARRGPVMPSRMSLRRTKQRVAGESPSSSSNHSDFLSIKCEKTDPDEIPKFDVTVSRMELNLKPPKKHLKNVIGPNILRDIENSPLSPLKMFEKGLFERISQAEVKELNLDPNQLIEQVRERFKKPKPLAVKKKIVNAILESVFDNVHKERTKTKEPVKEWNSPKKCSNTDMISIEENFKVNEHPVTEEKKKDSEECIKSHEEKATIKEEMEPSEGIVNAINNKDTVEDKTEANEENEVTNDVDESSNSTFQLPPEFIAEDNSNDSLPIFDTPKKLKPVHIQTDSSMEISKKDQIVNIDVVKIEDKETKSEFITNLDIKSPNITEKCAFKFSPLDKEELQRNKLDIDMESFKNQYLNEVDRDFQCTFNLQHVENEKSEGKLRTPIDFAVDAYEKGKKGIKRKIPDEEAVPEKKQKPKKRKSLRGKYDKTESEINVKCLENSEANIESVNVKVKKRSKRLKKHKTKVSINNKNIQVKIKWKKEQLKLKITGSKRGKKRERVPKTLRQYVLAYSLDGAKDVIARPVQDFMPIKKKQVKCEKSPDNLVQTSIQSFFKTKPQ